MEVKLESLSDIRLQNGYSSIEQLSKGDVIKARFSHFGVKLLFNNTWSFDYGYEVIQKYFKVHGQ